MLEIIQRLSPTMVDDLVGHLNGLKEHLSPQASTYASGRMHFWLEYEAPLSISRPWQLGVHDERLWSWITRQFQGEFELGLCAYGEVGIGVHRDAFYANFPALSINLGEVQGWYYDRQYPGYKWVPTDQQNPSDPVIYRVEPGDVLRFNCKNPHAPIYPAADRWSINLWSVSAKAREGFDRFKKGGSS